MFYIKESGTNTCVFYPHFGKRQKSADCSRAPGTLPSSSLFQAVCAWLLGATFSSPSTLRLGWVSMALCDWSVSPVAFRLWLVRTHRTAVRPLYYLSSSQIISSNPAGPSTIRLLRTSPHFWSPRWWFWVGFAIHISSLILLTKVLGFLQTHQDQYGPSNAFLPW